MNGEPQTHEWVILILVALALLLFIASEQRKIRQLQADRRKIREWFRRQDQGLG